MLSNHLILCHPILLPSVFSSTLIFFNESALCIRWSKYWSFRFIISPPYNSGMLSDSFWPHELQHARPPYLSPYPGVHPSSCPLNWWCYPTISFSATLLSFCLQSFPASESFLVSSLFAYWSFSFSISPSNKYSGLICIWSYHVIANRWGNDGNSEKIYFLGLQNHCGLWLQPWNQKTLTR